MIDKTDPAYHPEDHTWLANFLWITSGKLRRWKRKILCYVCSWKGHNFNDKEWGHLVGSKTHDQWCSRCDKIRGIPCAEHPRYDEPEGDWKI